MGSAMQQDRVQETCISSFPWWDVWPLLQPWAAPKARPRNQVTFVTGVLPVSVAPSSLAGAGP